MSRKRSLLPDLYKSKRKYVPSASCSTENNVSTSQGGPTGLSDLLTDTRTALMLLRSMFPEGKFENRLPPIILKHQVYSYVKNRTLADKQMNDMRASGEIKMFKLGAEAGERSLVFTNKVNSCIVGQCTDISLDKDRLVKDFGFTDLEITQLVHASVLTVRDVGSWWLSIPNAGIFLKTFIRGRKAVLTMIRKSKYREVLKNDLQKRRWPRLARLGILYHIHDVIGADLVDCISTTSGELLRLRE
ncbi:hypothetical protein BaRGS_00000936 [Batillaria attramentaria]|uniref:Serine/threonine-protein kinase 19 n=1 Tax=Batillaria attramentaria TaxID=370345 RepID=A0ABD0M951_9CAEN